MSTTSETEISYDPYDVEMSTRAAGNGSRCSLRSEEEEEEDSWGRRSIG